MRHAVVARDMISRFPNNPEEDDDHDQEDEEDQTTNTPARTKTRQSFKAFELDKSKKIGICLSFDYAVSMDGSDCENGVEIRSAVTSQYRRLDTYFLKGMDCSCFGASVGYHRRGDHARDHRASQGKNEAGQPRQNIRTFSYIELRTATDDFHPSNKIGRGGFGTVYKGILKDGTIVAVKTLSAGSRQGVREFFTEINTMSNVRHPNLVKLIGCHGERSTRILVYEYLENYSLDDALFGPNGRTVKLDWDRRSAICLGTARGVAYLHEELVPHIAWQLYEEGNLLELVDPDLEFFPKEEVIRYIKVAFFCTQAAANRRPLMSQVVEMLSKAIRLNEKLLTTPGLFHDSAGSNGKTSSDKSSLPDGPVSYEMSSDPVTFTQVTPR
ncbi:hypothetical protein RHMOL_Rhmol13G0234200 [Rhododendron molle]|uniref:Uncharacterized protein n=1 Tax=Rhododendron molle TaxID=49168 RepID=A0ACC0LAV8_RHOML|nr:hypothetical protein RHMOL_Rhmol13G0234200 [Rhododendron molle]